MCGCMFHITSHALEDCQQPRDDSSTNTGRPKNTEKDTDDLFLCLFGAAIFNLSHIHKRHCTMLQT